MAENTEDLIKRLANELEELRDICRAIEGCKHMSGWSKRRCLDAIEQSDILPKAALLDSLRETL